jgi:hypothetical protein
MGTLLILYWKDGYWEVHLTRDGLNTSRPAGHALIRARSFSRCAVGLRRLRPDLIHEHEFETNTERGNRRIWIQLHVRTASSNAQGIGRRPCSSSGLSLSLSLYIYIYRYKSKPHHIKRRRVHIIVVGIGVKDIELVLATKKKSSC